MSPKSKSLTLQPSSNHVLDRIHLLRMGETTDIIVYEKDKNAKLQVKTDGETVWLAIDQMAELFGRDKSVIGKHVRNVFKEGELEKDSVCANFASRKRPRSAHLQA